MKKIIYKILYKIGALFFKIHRAFYSTAARMEEPYLMTSDREKKRWYSDGSEKLRYLYEIQKDSVVIDVGGYEGDFASEIFSRYLCEIIVFEPVNMYVRTLRGRFAQNPNIKIIPKGLGAVNADIEISVMDEASSFTRDRYMDKAGAKEVIQVVDVADYFAENDLKSISLMKINIEGAEYDLLDRMAEKDLLRSVDNFQIQFHDFVPSYMERYTRIKRELEKTHKITYNYPFVWENWKKK